MLIKTTVALALLSGCRKKADESKPAAAVSPPAPAQPTPAPNVPARTPTPPPTTVGAVVTVTALDLAKDYKSDEISADDKYRNHPLQVTGEISQIDKDTMEQDDPGFVMFNTKVGDVSARFVDATKTKALKRGQNVTLQCRGGGFVAATAILEECTLLK